MSTWFKSTSVTVNAGEGVVLVNDSAATDILTEKGGVLRIGNFDFVQTAGVNIDAGTGKPVILLAEPWPFTSQTEVKAEAFITASSHALSAKILREVSEDFAAELAVREQLYISNEETVTMALPSGTVLQLRPWKKLEQDVANAVAQIPAKITEEFDTRMGAIRLQKLLNPVVKLPLKNSLEGQVAGGVTYGRAGAAAYVDQFGVLRTAANDEPRFEKEGVLLEDTSTNLVFPSEGLAFGSSSGLTITAFDVMGMSGFKAVGLVGESSGMSGNLGLSMSFDGGNVYAISMFAQSEGERYVRLQILSDYVIYDLQEGEFIRANSERIVADKVEAVAGGGYRISFVYKPDQSLISSLRFYLINSDTDITYTGDGINGVAFAGWQVEEKPYATSYIKTVDAPVTRAFDVPPTFDFLKNIPDVSSGGQSTYVFKASALGEPDETRVAFAASASTGLKHHLMRINAGSTDITYYRNGTADAPFDFTKQNFFAVTLDGDQVRICQADDICEEKTIAMKTYDPANFPSSFIIGGADGSGVWEGHITEVAIYDIALTQDEIKLLGELNQ